MIYQGSCRSLYFTNHPNTSLVGSGLTQDFRLVVWFLLIRLGIHKRNDSPPEGTLENDNDKGRKTKDRKPYSYK